MRKRTVSKPSFIKKKKEVQIHIGEYYASKTPSVVYTLLGSCVAVCLFDPETRIGGMNHILLPGNTDMKHFNDSARYGINAMELLINRIIKLGGKKNNLIAKTFGGANLLPAISRENGVGRKNIEFVLNFLQLENIKLISQDLGGKDSRKVYFHTDTGDVYLKRTISMHHKKQAEEQEQKAIKKIEKEANTAGSVTLF